MNLRNRKDAILIAIADLEREKTAHEEAARFLAHRIHWWQDQLPQSTAPPDPASEIGQPRP